MREARSCGCVLSHGWRRRISLAAVATDAHLEDLLRLALQGNQTPLRGIISLQTRIDLGPGEGDLLDRLRLDGRFGARGAHFTSTSAQDKVDSLSRRGLGQPKNQDIEDVDVGLAGRFALAGGRARLADLAFSVPGATVRLNGSFDLRSEELDFQGHLLLDAKLSRTTTGVKSLIARVLNPWFSDKTGGTDLPIRISGTRSQPKFGLALRHR